MVKFKIATLGCKVNQYDSADLKRKLIAAGFGYDPKDPDLVVLNTCAVTKTAARKARRKFKELKRDNPGAKMVLMGCWPKIYPYDSKLLGAELQWGTGKLDSLAEKIAEVGTPVGTPVGTDVGISVGTKDRNKSNGNAKIRLKSSGINSPRQGTRSRYFLKVQDGCQQFCTYCIIPHTRGKLASRPKQEILAEVAEAVAAGFREVVLCGIHLGLYGHEKGAEDGNLVQLIKEIIAIPELGRVRLSSIEINDISDELIETMKNSNKVCDHLHIPLQSGSDEILRSMNRPYDKKYFSQKVKAIRNAMPDISLTTDVIVGFPAETEQEFQKTLDYVRRVEFSRLHVFPFSAHEKAPASNFPGQVPKMAKKKRAEQMRQVGKELQAIYVGRFKGRRELMAVEKIEGNNVEGITEHYFKAMTAIPNSSRINPGIGSLLEVSL